MSMAISMLPVQKLDINKAVRGQLNGHTSRVFWFTGLSGPGKSTIVNESEKMYSQGIQTYLLDGDNVRLVFVDVNLYSKD